MHPLAGCHGDGALGHQHTRNQCASVLLVHGGPPELVAALKGDMSDDAWEELEACDWLNERAPEGYLWGWQDGDFGLWPTEEA